MKRENEKGQVAVLVSTGFGAGWASWNDNDAAMVFCPDLVDMVLAGAPADALVERGRELFPEAYVGGLNDGLKVMWVDKGTAFRIHEYDGSESLQILSELTDIYTA